MTDVTNAPHDADTHDDHPSEGQYTEVFIVLAVLTAIEVGLFFAPVPREIAVPALLILTALKFVLVIFWFMHLRFDHRIFRQLFYAGLALAAVIYAIVALIVLT